MSKMRTWPWGQRQRRQTWFSSLLNKLIQTGQLFFFWGVGGQISANARWLGPPPQELCQNELSLHIKRMTNNRLNVPMNFCVMPQHSHALSGCSTWCWYVLFEWDAINVTYNGRNCLCSLVGPPAAAFGRRLFWGWQSGEMAPSPCVN